ncbi:hypothetical protein ACFL27_19545 [candidate division CSSED10-310 bacterium]|uniref:Lipocalin-like domain-containing protein n=1 Tax=candidate division CSSED10-310 bacterium TaxID=2855610 RepID=A0ABV6Z1R3_UNCC1
MNKIKCFAMIFFVLTAILALSLFPAVFWSCTSGDDDDDNDDNDDVPELDLSGIWAVTYTVILDTCYDYPPGTTISDTWTITHTGDTIKIRDGEGDEFRGTVTERSFYAVFEDTITEGNCVMDVTVGLYGLASENNDNLISGSSNGQIEAHDAEACGFSVCLNQSSFTGTRSEGGGVVHEPEPQIPGHLEGE